MVYSHAMPVIPQSIAEMEITSWLVSTYDFYSLIVKNHKITRSLVHLSNYIIKKQKTYPKEPFSARSTNFYKGQSTISR